IEYFTELTAHQRSLAQVAIDAGADLVVGAHPHVIEPYEFYKGKLIVYSLGNFVFDKMYPEVVRRGNILTLTVQKNRLLAWELVTSCWKAHGWLVQTAHEEEGSRVTRCGHMGCSRRWEPTPLLPGVRVSCLRKPHK